MLTTLSEQDTTRLTKFLFSRVRHSADGSIARINVLGLYDSPHIFRQSMREVDITISSQVITSIKGALNDINTY